MNLQFQGVISEYDPFKAALFSRRKVSGMQNVFFFISNANFYKTVVLTL